jgi:hypothetical protein
MTNLPSWVKLSIIASAVLLSSALAFLAAMAVEISIGLLMEAGLPTCVALLATGVVGGSLFYKLRVRPQGTAEDRP